MSAEVSVMMRDGSIETHFLRSKDALNDDEQTNDNDSFWGTESDQRRLVPKDAVRASSIDYDTDFDYGGISYDDHESDSDYM